MVNQVILITINHYEPAIAEQDYHEASVALRNCVSFAKLGRTGGSHKWAEWFVEEM